MVITGLITVGLAITTGGASAVAQLELALAAAGLALTGINVYGSIRGIMVANEMKEASNTMHEAKKAAKVMAESIAQLSLSVVDLLLTGKDLLKVRNKNVAKSTSEVYLEKLNEKSINKLKNRKDSDSIIRKYKEYFGDNVEFVNELIENTPGKEIYVEPIKLLVKNAENQSSFYDFCKGMKTRCPTNEQWVKCQIDCYNHLPKDSRLRINAQPIISARYLKPDGTIDWPKFMGMIPETIKGISPDNNLPTNLSRKGVTDFGNTFGDNPNLTNAEIAIPYLDNPQAVHFANLSDEGKKLYFELIDALNDDNQIKFRKILDLPDTPESKYLFTMSQTELYKWYNFVENEITIEYDGIKGLKLDKFNYKIVNQNTNIESCFCIKYGLNGIVAPWKNDEIYLVGGADQFSLPFTMDLLETLNIINKKY